MTPRDQGYLLDILLAARLVCEFVKDVSRTEFDDSLLIQSAVMRQLEIIGEAAKRLSFETRAELPDLPWQQMAGMRDILIHAYRKVDLTAVWQAATVSAPGLIPKLEPLIPPAG
jgi:uncharacterized protein with HEPN domain